MNKEESIRKKTWEYFWQQKWDEMKPAGKTFFCVFLTLFSPFGMGTIIYYIFPQFYKGILGVDYLTWGILIWFGGAFIIGILTMVFLLASMGLKWIRGNWEWARERAEKDYKVKRKRTAKNSETN